MDEPGRDARRALRRAIESLLRDELRVTGIHQVCVRCGSPDHGRPVVRVEDDAAPHVSWSYAAGLAVVAWTWAAPIGVDVENTGADLAVGWTRVGWTRAEAVLKAAGEGLARSAAGVDDVEAWTMPLPLPPTYVGHLAVIGDHATAPVVSWRLVGPAAPSR